MASSDDVEVLNALIDAGLTSKLTARSSAVVPRLRTPLDAAQRSQANELVRWLRSHGARSATEGPDVQL